ncbi:hypothetical protein BU14_0065s0009 [Porphyra umbilicalis]|uniref:Uncharacterized protein n=1 Tax=Porphyra umbilicalis TaxID=2786 RepID=A0A1X6PGV3_PORUM|nr:hypothetical protein BU14_0065s0009 [Porphyra umbilicalis]|eukprot:OSX80005.1 hypothetical protein BU14_0065s0009 [Porphyra umbilicalis]
MQLCHPWHRGWPPPSGDTPPRPTPSAVPSTSASAPRPPSSPSAAAGGCRRSATQAESHATPSPPTASHHVGRRPEKPRQCAIRSRRGALPRLRGRLWRRPQPQSAPVGRRQQHAVVRPTGCCRQRRRGKRRCAPRGCPRAAAACRPPPAVGSVGERRVAGGGRPAARTRPPLGAGRNPGALANRPVAATADGAETAAAGGSTPSTAGAATGRRPERRRPPRAVATRDCCERRPRSNPLGTAPAALQSPSPPPPGGGPPPPPPLPPLPPSSLPRWRPRPPPPAASGPKERRGRPGWALPPCPAHGPRVRTPTAAPCRLHVPVGAVAEAALPPPGHRHTRPPPIRRARRRSPAVGRRAFPPSPTACGSPNGEPSERHPTTRGGGKAPSPTRQPTAVRCCHAARAPPLPPGPSPNQQSHARRPKTAPPPRRDPTTPPPHPAAPAAPAATAPPGRGGRRRSGCARAPPPPPWRHRPRQRQ